MGAQLQQSGGTEAWAPYKKSCWNLGQGGRQFSWYYFVYPGCLLESCFLSFFFGLWASCRCSGQRLTLMLMSLARHHSLIGCSVFLLWLT